MNITDHIRRITASPVVQKILGNFGWLVGERGLTLLLSLTVNIWLARYLGAELYGSLNYAVAFVGLFGTFTYLGLSGIIVRDLVENPDDRDQILGTVLGLKLVGALLALGAIAAAAFWQVDSGREQLLVAILAGGMVFESASVVDFWYKSRVEEKYVVRASAAASVFGAFIKCALILLEASLVAFVVAIVIQHALRTAGLFYIYNSHGLPLRDWRFSISRARSLLSRSWPLILSSIGSVIYLKIDQVMIGHFADKAEVGIYAVAVRFSEIWYFIPTALASSLFPSIIKLKERTEEEYHAQMQRIYRIMVIVALAIALPVTLLARPGISFLYGAEYAAAGDVLMIHIWACPAIFMAAVLSKWLISEDLLIFSFTRHGFGALANVALNIVLIPEYGAAGAAISTVASYTVASYLSCFTDRRTFRTGIMMTRALFLPFKNVLQPQGVENHD